MFYWIAVHNWYEIGLFVWLKYLYPTEPKLITVLNFGKVSLSHVSTYISLQTINLDFWLFPPTYTYIYILGFHFIYIAIYFVYITTQSMYMFHFPEYPRRERIMTISTASSALTFPCSPAAPQSVTWASPTRFFPLVLFPFVCVGGVWSCK